jgi:hypothetical protein
LEDLELQIQSFWQDDLSQTEPSDTVDETATEADQTTEQDGEAMVQTGAKQYILAEDLLDASVEDSGAGVSEEPAGADAAQEDLAETEDSMVQTIGNVEEITVDATTGEVSYVLVSLNAVSSIVIDEAPAGGVEAPTDGRVDETTADESQTVFTDTTQLATIELVPIPFTAVDWNGEEEVLIYTGSESLEEAPALSFEAIESGGFDWTSEADSYWGLEGSETESQ